MIATNKNDREDEHEFLLNIDNDETSNLINSCENESTVKSSKLKTIGKIKKCQGLVRNKRCDKTADNNFSVSGNIYQLSKKKPIIVFIVLLLLVFYINSTVMPWNATEKIPVVHNSHVPGMKEMDITSTSEYYDNHKIISAIYNNNNTSSIGINSINDILNSTSTNGLIMLNSTIIYSNSSIIATSPTPTNLNSNTNLYLLTTILPPLPSGFLVWSDKCKMPNIDPYDAQIMKYFKREKYEACSKSEPLTNIQFNSTTKQYILNINEKGSKNYGSTLECCYQDILRKEKGKNADRRIKLSECSHFKNSAQLPNTTDNILVRCQNKKHPVYLHGHAMMPERAEIRERLDTWSNNITNRPPSILMIGIDSISRINLLRAMPKTAQKLYDNEWFEMSGYNKMDDNTFPNLMAILTGFNNTNAYKICDPKKLHKLDDCPMIWKLFHEHGYVTAYAEDEVSISTFNYLKQGFEVPPVDYYLRPFMIAAEKNFPIHQKSGLTFCLGYKHSADYVFDYAIELATRYKHDPFFGLFWANTFSHNDISDCSSMDFKVVEYLEKLSTSGILNETVVIFFSDHGMRFGPTRKFLSGHLEERLPFMFIWLPQWLKTKYPEFVNGLSINKNHLTNPYDIHMTLKNLLELSGRTSKNLPKAPDCPNCQSLLRPVPYNRSCQDISIEDHWCTCIPYQSIDLKTDLVHKLAIFIVDYINDYVQNFKNGSISHLCGKIQLNDVIGAYRANLLVDYPKNLELYRLVITTAPGKGLFEATIRRKINTEEFEITGSISRLNSYAWDSKCISDSNLKKYCHCSKKATKSKTVVKTKIANT